MLKIFKYHNYAPLPFIILMFLYREPNIWSIILGFAVIFLGEGIRIWATGYSGAKKDNSLNAETDCLIAAGPFAYVRYPHYLGNILLYSGIVIMSSALFPILLIAVIFYFSYQYKSLIRQRESTFDNKFSKDYTDYINSVPVLFPRIIPYREKSLSKPSFNVKAALNLERGNLKAYCFLSLTLIIIWFIGRF